MKLFVQEEGSAQVRALAKGGGGIGVKRGLTEKSVTPSPRSAGRGRGEAAGVRVGRVLDLKWPWASS
jgi:hypothetical protein